MNRVYAVSIGDGIDYRIVAVFTDRTKAVAFMDAIPAANLVSGGHNDIEVFVVDPDVSKLRDMGYKVWENLVSFLEDRT